MFEAKVNVMNSRITDNMEFWVVRGERKEERGGKGRGVVPMGSTASVER